MNNPLSRKPKKELAQCVLCEYIRPAVKFKVGNKKRINEASCVKRGIFIKDKDGNCPFQTEKIIENPLLTLGKDVK